MKIFVILALLLTITLEQEDCRFAKKYTLEQLKSSPDAVEAFLREAIQWETKFIKEVAVDQKSGMTLDG